jgi:hypothetical protein
VAETNALLLPREVDLLLRYPAGRSKRLAKAGKIPHVILPDGQYRFRALEIERLLADAAPLEDAEKGNHAEHL